MTEADSGKSRTCATTNDLSAWHGAAMTASMGGRVSSKAHKFQMGLNEFLINVWSLLASNDDIHARLLLHFHNADNESVIKQIGPLDGILFAWCIC